jgi:hypothetical protein
MIYIIHAQNIFFDKNIIDNNTLVYEKYQNIVSKT